MNVNEMNDLYSNLSEESIEIFEEDVIGFFLSHAIEDACKKGKGSRSQIEEVFEPIFNLIIEFTAHYFKYEKAFLFHEYKCEKSNFNPSNESLLNLSLTLAFIPI